jgi:hypothetical protein
VIRAECAWRVKPFELSRKEGGPRHRPWGPGSPVPRGTHALAEPQHADQQLLHLAPEEHVVVARREEVLVSPLGHLELGAIDPELQADLTLG